MVLGLAWRLGVWGQEALSHPPPPPYNGGWLREQVVFSWSTYYVLGTLLGAFHAVQLLMLFMAYIQYSTSAENPFGFPLPCVVENRVRGGASAGRQPGRGKLALHAAGGRPSRLGHAVGWELLCSSPGSSRVRLPWAVTGPAAWMKTWKPVCHRR